MEVLEERKLLASQTGPSLAAISNQTVPTLQGLPVTLDGSGTTDPQTFAVTSSNPAVAATIAQGQYWTLDFTYNDTSNPSTNFTGPLTFQLFGNLTPTTVNNIETFTNDMYYDQTGKYITRVINGFPNAASYIIQGGAPNSAGTGNSGQPGTPFANENLQQLAFTGTDQLAMANAGATSPTNDTQFFITTGSPNSELGYNYTIFGQLVPNPSGETSAQTILSDLTGIPVSANPNLVFNGVAEVSLPDFPPTYTASLSSTNPSGVLILDATQAAQGQTSTITVTATDSVTGTSTSQSFLATVGAYTGPTSSSLIQTINFKPLANPVTAATTANAATTVTLNGQGTFPVSGVNQDLTYSLASQPAHGTVTNFNAATGTLSYTPDPGYTGNDTLQYTVTSSGPNTSASPATSNPGTVTVTVGPSAPVETGAVRVVGNTLIVTPVPRVGHHTNYIDVIQVPSTATSSTPAIQVYVNNQLDINQPAIATSTTSGIFDIIVFGGKANDVITIDPTVQIPAVLDGGHGGRNRLKSGSTETLMHGWFGQTTLVGGSGPNQMIGRAGQVKFKPSKSTDLIFAGSPQPRTPLLNATPPQGTFYIYKKGKLIAVPLSRLYPHKK